MNTRITISVIVVLSFAFAGPAWTAEQRASTPKRMSIGTIQTAPMPPPERRLKTPVKKQRYTCNTDQGGFVECVCVGMLDCKALLDSGKCKGKSVWQDSNDPSVGGCEG